MTGWGNLSKYGEFEIIGAREGRPRLLGEGSYGKTFEAARRETIAGDVIEERVALKVLNPDLLRSQTKRYQFIQELRALSIFKHPNLVQYSRCGEEGGEVYYAMELCKGGDLAQLVKRFGPLPERVAALIGLQVAAGLKEMHRKRAYHRDIKPSNVMLVDELEPDIDLAKLEIRLQQQENLCRIVDFGLVEGARLANAAEGDQVPQSMKFAGSPMYASPEQIREKPVDERSDIYCLGMTLWYLVQGCGPLLDDRGRDLRSSRDAMARHITPEPHDSAFPADLHPSFRQILSRMVAKEPEDRYLSAAALERALRDFLSEAPVEEEAPSLVSEVQESLDSIYTFQEPFPAKAEHRSSRRSFLAVEHGSSERVLLTVIEDLENRPSSPEINAHNLERLDQLALAAVAPDYPEGLLAVHEVIRARDALAVVEELPPPMTLADLLMARGRRQPFDFSEAVAVLAPVAEAVDFASRHGGEKLSLTADDIWLDCADWHGQRPDSKRLGKPVDEWQGLRVKLSLLSQPAKEGGSRRDSSASSWAEHTVTLEASSFDDGSSADPLRALSKLIYRILNGAEVAAIATFNPDGYVPTVALGSKANCLIRDVLCGHEKRPTAMALLRELCQEEGVVLRNNPPGSSSSSTRRSPASSQLRRRGNSRGSGAGVSQGAGASGGRSGGSTSRESSKGTAPGGTVRPLPPRATGTAPAAPSGSASGSGSVGLPPTAILSASREDPVCEVVEGRPGWVRSPRDAQRREFEVPPTSWQGGGAVACPFTGGTCRLPLMLGPLMAEVLGPGQIRSPYYPQKPMHVPWPQWVAGAEVTCEFTGRKLRLPGELPPVVAEIIDGEQGLVRSPFNGEAFRVAPQDWTPGLALLCPFTQLPLVLPGALPELKLLGRVDHERPGIVFSPYTEPEREVPVPPALWVEDGLVSCPVTGRSIRLPVPLPLLPALVDARRLGVVRSPFSPQTECRVELEDWTAGHSLVCPATRRTFVLPQDLPPWIADAEWVPGVPGRVRSPFKPHVELDLSDAEWKSGALILCPVTGREFRVPVDEALPTLALERAAVDLALQEPELDPVAASQSLKREHPGATPIVIKGVWQRHHLSSVEDRMKNLEVGELVPARPGEVRSPYGSRPFVTVEGPAWEPGARVRCPQTGRPFLLPNDLPPLEARLAPGRLGMAGSPYVTEGGWVDVGMDEWRAGAAVRCPATGRNFVLPKNLPSWEPEGEVIPGRAGWIRSPFRGGREIQVAAADWAQGTRVRCPDTGRYFVLPANLPLMEATVMDAAEGLVQSPFAPNAQPMRIPPIAWQPGAQLVCEATGRDFVLPQQLGKIAQRATLVTEKAGWVTSPYGHRMQVAVPGSQWVPNGRVPCPETGDIFLLPDTLPPLTAEAIPGVAGEVISPYTRGNRVKVDFAQWQRGAEVLCPQTRRPFILPPDLPAWNKAPTGKGKLYAALGAGLLVGLIVLFFVFKMVWSALLGAKSGQGVTPPGPPEKKGKQEQPLPSTPSPRELVIRRGLVPSTAAILLNGNEAKPDSRSDGLHLAIPSGAGFPLELQFRAPGYEPESIRVASASDVQIDRPVELRRLRGRLAIRAPTRGSPHDRIQISMTEALKDEAGFVPVDSKTATESTPSPGNEKTIDLPTGIYRINVLSTTGAAAAEEKTVTIVAGGLAKIDLQEVPPPPLKLVFSGGITPASATLTINGKKVDLTREGGQVFATLPAPQTFPLDLQFSAPGYLSGRAWTISDPNGLSITQPVSLERESGAVQVLLAKNGTDYDYVEFSWAAPLGESQVMGQAADAPKPKRVDLNGTSSPISVTLPTGYYKLTLLSELANIRPRVLLEKYGVGSQDGSRAIQLPDSFAGTFVSSELDVTQQVPNPGGQKITMRRTLVIDKGLQGGRLEDNGVTVVTDRRMKEYGKSKPFHGEIGLKDMLLDEQGNLAILVPFSKEPAGGVDEHIHLQPLQGGTVQFYFYQDRDPPGAQRMNHRGQMFRKP